MYFKYKVQSTAFVILYFKVQSTKYIAQGKYYPTLPAILEKNSSTGELSIRAY